MSTNLRKSIQHIGDLSCGKLRELLTSRTVGVTVTEKTDGNAFEFGVDEEGFYTRTSTSDKMRRPGDYWQAAANKFGDRVDRQISQTFDHYHQVFQSLTEHITGPWFLRGELFPLTFGSIEGNVVTFVGTPYYLDCMGDEGTFVVHTQLPQGVPLEVNHISLPPQTVYGQISSALHPHIWIFEDTVAVEDIFIPQWLQEIGRTLPSRLPKDPTLRRWFEIAKTEFEHQINKHIAKYEPSWGPETEGYVFYPECVDWSFKVIDPGFNERKTRNGW